MSIDLEQVRKRLLERREELLAVTETSRGSRDAVELDQTRVGRLSRMDALQGQAMAIETERRRRIELGRIESALRRIEEGEYGYCVVCGEEIAPKRLAFDPTVPTCIECASRGERAS